jgi:hypothetical protein
MKFLKSKNGKKFQKIESNSIKSQKGRLYNMIHGFDDSTKEKVDLLNFIYPVGSIYISVNTTSPATLFGGTWEQIKDRFLLSSGDTYASGTTGGEATHTLTINEIPSHSHAYTIPSNQSTGSGLKYSSQGDPDTITFGTTQTENAGGGAAHNNMPPYLVVNVWKRTE